MTRGTILICSGLVICLFALALIAFISYYAITENLNAAFYFLLMPIVIFIIGFMILRHGVRLN